LIFNDHEQLLFTSLALTVFEGDWGLTVMISSFHILELLGDLAGHSGVFLGLDAAANQELSHTTMLLGSYSIMRSLCLVTLVL
jgi:hypothetical protein